MRNLKGLHRSGRLVSPDASTEAPERPAERLPVGTREIVAVVAILAMFLASQGLAVFLVEPFVESKVPAAFEDPEDPLNGVWLLGTVIVFTAIILLIVRLKLHWVMQALILLSVGTTLVYVLYPLLDLLPIAYFQEHEYTLLGQSFGLNPAVLVAFLPAAALTWSLKRFPEWYIVDAVGIGVSAGAIALFGASFTPTTYVFVLVAFAIYDALSVYRTKHMLTLADSVLDMHLPIMLVVPKHLDYSFLEERGTARARAEAPSARPRDAMFIGLGDIVIPSIFGLTALKPGIWMATVGCFAGVSIGLLVLLWFVLKGRPHAGLPTLNAGALVGFVAGWTLQTREPLGWISF